MTASSVPLLLLRAPAPAARDEVRRQVGLAEPLVACSLQVVSVMFASHLGELPLSAASFANVTGFNVLVFEARTVTNSSQEEQEAATTIIAI
ncbi:hypothetical protein ZWY2020_001153 [Hordeum vulgare]|nr:hypothetical protein ZWY2020_001153 [Hordeum vulgare]